MSVISEDTVKGSFHQGDSSHFRDQTLGHQCMANAVAAALYAAMLPVNYWSKNVLDRILFVGDELYRRRCNNQYQYLQFSDIRETEVLFGQQHDMNGNAPMTGLLQYESAPSPPFFRWFKFTLKPPYSIACGKLQLAIWDTSFWTFWLKFGHKTPWDIS